MIDIKDRIVEHPNRYRLKPVEGQPEVYDIEPEPGEVTESGTLINAELFRQLLLLSPETAALYGLTGEDATVDGALLKVKNSIHLGKYSAVGGGSAITDGTTTIVSFSSLIRDDFNAVNLSLFPSRITIPSGISTVRFQLITVNGSGGNSDVGEQVVLMKNGTDLMVIEARTGRNQRQCNAMSPPLEVSENDYFQMKIIPNNSTVRIPAGSSMYMEVLE